MQLKRYNSRLQCRIFPSALNRNREASFPPIACSSSCSFVSLDFFLCFFLETALPSDVTGLSVFILHSPFSNDMSGGPRGHYKSKGIYGNFHSSLPLGSDVVQCSVIYSWPVSVENWRLLTALRISPELPEHSVSNNAWSEMRVIPQLCLELWKKMYFKKHENTHTKMRWQLQGFLSPFLPPELKFDSGPSSLWLEPLD